MDFAVATINCCDVSFSLFVVVDDFKVARKLADMIELLVAHGMELDDLLIVGHSLGAHISGCAAKLLTSGKPAIIIGLDPAKVDYDFYETAKRLSDNDAGYVQVIHTDSDKFGFAEPMGHGNI